MENRGSQPMQDYVASETSRLLLLLEQEMIRVAGQSDPDAVHDVRVAIRRFTQALRTFGRLLPRRPAKKIRKRLRKVLNAAAAVRDLDIALGLLSETRLAQSHSLWEESRAQRYAAELAFRSEIGQVSLAGRTARWRADLGLEALEVETAP